MINYIHDILSETKDKQLKKERFSMKKYGENSRFRKLIYYILGVLEVLLAFRLVLKILGSNPENMFVNAIYTSSNIFLTPFSGIFSSVATEGIETNAVLEPAVIIAMIVYALIVYGIVKLIEIIINRSDSDVR